MQLDELYEREALSTTGQSTDRRRTPSLRVHIGHNSQEPVWRLNNQSCSTDVARSNLKRYFPWSIYSWLALVSRLADQQTRPNQLNRQQKRLGLHKRCSPCHKQPRDLVEATGSAHLFKKGQHLRSTHNQGWSPFWAPLTGDCTPMSQRAQCVTTTVMKVSSKFIKSAY